jgi:hypothetical protein
MSQHGIARGCMKLTYRSIETFHFTFPTNLILWQTHTWGMQNNEFCKEAANEEKVVHGIADGHLPARRNRGGMGPYG